MKTYDELKTVAADLYYEVTKNGDMTDDDCIELITQRLITAQADGYRSGFAVAAANETAQAETPPVRKAMGLKEAKDRVEACFAVHQYPKIPLIKLVRQAYGEGYALGEHEQSPAKFAEKLAAEWKLGHEAGRSEAEADAADNFPTRAVEYVASAMHAVERLQRLVPLRFVPGHTD